MSNTHPLLIAITTSDTSVKHLLWLLLLALPACDSGSPETTRIYVADQKAACVGVAPQECLLVREDPADPWTLFYDAINGFTFEAGYFYTLDIEILPVPNPPADGSSERWVLVRIIEIQPAD